jgi:hypothetical protein
MAAGFLTAAEVQELEALYLRAFEFTKMLRKQCALARHVAVPRLPAALSESIAALSVESVFGTGSAPCRPGKLNDLGVERNGRGLLLIAVKGTGPSRWISVTATDLAADCLLWVDYGDRLVKRTENVWLWIFDRPVKTWAGTGRLTLAQAKSHFGREPRRCAWKGRIS